MLLSFTEYQQRWKHECWRFNFGTHSTTPTNIRLECMCSSPSTTSSSTFNTFYSGNRHFCSPSRATAASATQLHRTTWHRDGANACNRSQHCNVFCGSDDGNSRRQLRLGSAVCSYRYALWRRDESWLGMFLAVDKCECKFCILHVVSRRCSDTCCRSHWAFVANGTRIWIESGRRWNGHGYIRRWLRWF